MLELASEGFWHAIVQLRLADGPARLLRSAITGYLRGSPPPVVREEEFSALIEAVGESLLLDEQELRITNQPVEVHGESRVRVVLVSVQRDGWDMKSVGGGYDGRRKKE